MLINKRRIILIIGAIIILCIIGIIYFFSKTPSDTPSDVSDTLSAPTTVTAHRASNHSIEISWNQVEGASGYRIYRYDDEAKEYKPQKDIKNQDETSYKDWWLSKDTVYKYKVAAYEEGDDKRHYSKTSFEVSCKTYTDDSETANAGKITFNHEEVDIKETESANVEVTIHPSDESKKLLSDEKTMYSSDEAVATIDEDGKVLARSSGTCFIYCRAHNGNVNKLKVVVGMGETADSIPIITYHRIYTDEEKQREEPSNFTNLNVSKSAFAEQMKWLYDQGYRTISCDEFQQWCEGQIQLPKKTVMITFDDGYYNVYENALTEIEKYGFKATMFIIGKYSEGNQSGDTMGQDTIAKITEEYPDFDFQSHTYNMHTQVKNFGVFDALSPDELKGDFDTQKSMYGFDYIAYPYGQYNAKMTSMAEKTGIKMGFTYKGRKRVYATKNHNRYEIPRFMIDGDKGMDKFVGIFK